MHPVRIILFLVIPLLFTSCLRVEEPYEAELLVQVKGLLSGNPRDGLPVLLYESKSDAELDRWPIAPVTYTDPYGEVLFYGLVPGRTYYIRVEALLNTKVRSSGRLDGGANICVIRFF